MVEVEMTKDIRDYEPKLFGLVTGRQIILLAVGCAYSIPLAMIIPTDFATKCMIAVLALTPMFLLGWVEVYGMKMEKFLLQIIRYTVLTPSKRKYKVDTSRDFIKEPQSSKQKKKKIIKSAEYKVHK